MEPSLQTDILGVIVCKNKNNCLLLTKALGFQVFIRVTIAIILSAQGDRSLSFVDPLLVYVVVWLIID